MSGGGAVGSGVGRIGRRVVYGSPGLAALAGKWRPRACVLLYHRVASPHLDLFGQAVEPERFAEHLEAVRRRYPVVSLDALLDGLHGGDYPDGAVAVTFDDGYADTLTTAYPIAAAHDVPIHVFVTAGPVEAGEEAFWWDELAALSPPGDGGYGRIHDELRRLPATRRAERLAELRANRPAGDTQAAGRPLRPDELVELARLPLARVGAHTVTHPALAALSTDDQRDELRESRRRLESLSGTDVDVLAYPFGKSGDVSRETQSLAAEAGYRAALLSTPRALVPSSDPFGLPRIAVHDWSGERLLRRIAEVLGPVRA